MVKYIDFDFSNLNVDFYTFDRARLISSKPLEKRLSSGAIDYSNIYDQNDFLRRAITYLTKIAFDLFTYITEEKNPIINLTFKTKDSYCELTNNKIVINLNVLLNSEVPYQQRVDIIIGLIFHEFYHKKITITSIAEILEIPRKKYYDKTYSHPLERFVKKTIDTNLKRHILNILEDYRIEKLGIKALPGYGFFFDELRKFAFYHLSNVDFMGGDNYVQVFQSLLLHYFTIFILMPELEPLVNSVFLNYLTSSSVFIDYLPCYNDFKEEVLSYVSDNDNLVYSDQLHEIITATNDIHAIFCKHAQIDDKKLKEEKPFNKGANNNSKLDTIDNDTIEMLQDLQADIVKGFEANNSNSSINIKIESIEKDDNFPNFNHVKIISAKCNEVDINLFKKASSLSKDIGNSLGFLNARYNRKRQLNELSEGEIDEDELYSIAFNPNIFYHQLPKKIYELDFGILLDESGSMGEHMREAKLACLILMLGLKNNKHINLYVYGHTANHEVEEGKENLIMYKYYNSKENFVNHNTIYEASSKSNNADGFAIDKMCQIIQKNRSKNKVLVVISDGQPNAEGYIGEAAIQHTHDIIKKWESKGFSIIQICIDNIESSDKMFTHFIPYTDNNDFINNLKNILKTIINKLQDCA